MLMQTQDFFKKIVQYIKIFQHVHYVIQDINYIKLNVFNLALFNSKFCIDYEDIFP
ncbi:unnamed protein product [Paramecium primaurelia]|uniref:Uncharacterized protein n=1 Tax=Paramecium primaurelia TaxID=5886 RepID=A0A8S1PC73_PARPR|nr:unnamed protein product [Paramecium primaurelia]